jgi:hypothetical protein
MTPIFVAIVLMVLLAWQSLRLLRRKQYVILLIWPAFIYLIGPAATLLFAEHPVLGTYVDETRLTSQTLLMGWYLLLLLAADKAFGLSSSLRKSLQGSALQRLSSSPAFPVVYLCAGLAATALQTYTLLNFGSIFTGSYILEDAAEGLIPYWGFLAGLYEIVFLCFILALSGTRPSKRVWLIYVGLYVLTTMLRVFGGTRLILIKELAFMILLFYLRGTIKARQLLIVGALVVAAGSAVGLLRSGGGDESNTFLGPLYGLVMESALNALTFGIADQVNQSGAVSRDADTLGSIVFLLVSVVPSFLRLGFGEAEMAAISPYSLALRAGFDTSAPVGGMSGFATIDYLSGYPHLFLLVMVVVFAVSFRMLHNGAFKQMLGLVIVINAIHFWRDPADIAFKLLVQGLLICVLFYVVARRKRRRAGIGAQRPVPPLTPAPVVSR